MNEVHDDVTGNHSGQERYHDVVSLRQQYGVSRHEARRLLERFGNSRVELDLLLAGRGRTSAHRRREVRTPASNAAFGID